MTACSFTHQTNHAAMLYIPQLQASARKARPERQARRPLQQRAGFERGTQAIVGNVRRQMVNMMVANVAGPPMQHLREIVVGAAGYRSSTVIPGCLSAPIRAVEGVLHVE